MNEQPLLDLPVELERRRARILNSLLMGAVVGGGITMLALAYAAWRGDTWLRALPFFTAYAVLVFVFVNRRLRHDLRVVVTVGLIYLVGIYILQLNGVGSSGSWFLLLAPFFMFVLQGARAGIGTLVLSVLVYAFFSLAHYAGWGGWVAIDRPYNPIEIGHVLNMGANFVMLLIVLGVLQWLSAQSEARSLRDAHRHIAELDQAQRLLQERAVELSAASRQSQKHAWQLEIAADMLDVTRGVVDPGALLSQAVQLLYERWREGGVNCVGVFMLAPSTAGERVELRAVAEEGGLPSLEMLSVPRGVYQALRSGDPHAGRQTAGGWELTFPFRGEIGRTSQFDSVLYMRSDREDAFSEDDFSPLQTLADQLSIAFQNALLLQRAQAQLQEMTLYQQRYTMDTWRDVMRTGARFMYAQGQIESAPGAAPVSNAIRESLQEERAVVGCDEQAAFIAVPITVRGLVIGAVDIKKSGDTWSREQIELVETLVGQLGIALDSASLFQDTQRRAIRERLVGEVTARMRETLNMDTILKTAAQEVRQALELPEVVIRLSPPADEIRESNGQA